MTSVDDRLARLRTLTPREQEVLVLLSQLYLNKEIAQTLGIAIRTVSFHNANIYLKLGINVGLPSSVRRVELGKFCSLLAELDAPAPEDEPPSPPTVLPPLLLEQSVPALLAEDPTDTKPYALVERTEDNADPQLMAFMLATQAALEDQLLLVQYRSSAQPRVEYVRGVGSPARPAIQRRSWRHISTYLVLILGLLLGSGGTALLLQRESAAPPEMSAAGSTPTALATPAAPCPAAGAVAATEKDRFVRSQGISSFTVENTAKGVLTDWVRALTIDSRAVWIGSFATQANPAGGLGAWNRQAWFNCNSPAGVAGVNVNALATDKRGWLWVATEKHGIARYDGTSWQTFTVTNTKALPTNETFGLTIDDQDNIWVATWEGVVKFDGTTWSHPYTSRNNTLASGPTHTIAFDSVGGLWIGHMGGPTRTGGVSHRSADNVWHYYTTGKSLEDNDVKSIVVQAATADTPETVWVATVQGGLSRFQSGSWLTYRVADGLPSATVHALAIDPLNRVWAATAKGVVFFDGARWIGYHDFETFSLAFGPACQDCPYNTDHVWTGTTQGLTHSRLPRKDPAIDINTICFQLLQGAPNQEMCSPMEVGTDTITVTNPLPLNPGDRFYVNITVRPRTPHQLKTSDFLSNTDSDDQLLFGSHVNMPVTEVTEAGAPYTFTNHDTPFIAPQPKTKDAIFVSTWRLWMYTRYVGPAIRIQFRVQQP
jgi:hypothetical protein